MTLKQVLARLTSMLRDTSEENRSEVPSDLSYELYQYPNNILIDSTTYVSTSTFPGSFTFTCNNDVDLRPLKHEN